MEPLAAAIVFADPARPTVLAIPEANLAVIAVLNRDHQHCTCDEIRTFDMLNFCEVGRYVDPDRPADRLGADVASIALLVHGDCQPDVASAIAAALTDQQMAGARIGFDEHRLSAAVAGRMPHQFVDALDLMLRARVVKTAPEIARYRQLGTVADRVIAHAGTLLRPGVEWTDVQAQLCDFMVRQGAIPVDEGAMLFGGTYDGEDFIPDLFRTTGRRQLRDGDIVILETQGVYDGFWIDINRTAVIGKPSPAFQQLHDILRDAFLLMVDQLRPGTNTNSLPAIGYDYLRSKGVATPEKLLVVAHGIGLMPLEIPLPYPSAGLAGVKQGFVIEEDMLISLDSLFFGARLGPCHMENVYAITAHEAEPMYHTPLQLIRGGQE
jgi:Xaa-Pro aminopeptidase